MEIFYRKTLWTCLLLFSSIACFSKGISPNEEKKLCLSIHNNWMNMSLNLTKNTVGYSAPVAARSFNYLSIGMYESVVELMNDYQSLDGQITSYKRPKIAIHYPISYQHLSNVVDLNLVRFLFENMPPNEAKKVEGLYLKQFKKYKKKYSKKAIRNAENYASQLTSAIIEWSKKDGGDNAWNKNFPSNFKPGKCEGCWEKTLPGYVSALQPYWGTNTLMVKSNREISSNIPYLPFSKDSLSKFYLEAKKVYDLKVEKKEKTIAEYWNDAPGVSGTPAGHIYSIGYNLSINEHLNIDQTLELYVLLGLALNDAVIESWRLKYKYNLIRPITYIHRYISKEFTPTLTTPPFPEFPSGHSFQAGAATKVLSSIFGEDYSFTDSTNISRVDIKGQARDYTSFHEMAEEMSISRLYGGIHYNNTLTISLDYGRKIGLNTISNIKLKKE